MSNLPPEEPDYVPLRWWEVVLGAIGVAVVAFALIWGFALLDAVSGAA
jgi:hypothetical protein